MTRSLELDTRDAPWHSRPGILVALGACLVAALLGLSWFDVLPGGWRLRTLFVSQGERDVAARAEHRAARLRQFAKEPSAPGGVLFIGSSTIEGFDLNGAFPSDGAAERDGMAKGPRLLNRGIGDEDLALLRERLIPTVEHSGCRAIVIYAASVDLRRPTGGDELIAPPRLAVRTAAVIDDLLGVDADLRITMIGVLPETDNSRGVRERVTAFNTALRAICGARPRVTFIRTNREPLVDPASGLLNPDCARDHLHLNADGYRVLAEWLRAGDPPLRALLDS